MKYWRDRGYENLEKDLYPGEGPYDIPAINPVVMYEPPKFLAFDRALRCSIPEKRGVHFFMFDYMFQRVWDSPGDYIKVLKPFTVVCSPDFSLFTDFPLAFQIWNHYRKHWVARYWQENGVRIIPSICWSDERSYDWCFDGEPTHSTVMVSNVGTQKDSQAKRLFVQGYREMLDRLQPSNIFFYGDKVPDACEGHITQIMPFQSRLREIK